MYVLDIFFSVWHTIYGLKWYIVFPNIKYLLGFPQNGAKWIAVLSEDQGTYYIISLNVAWQFRDGNNRYYASPSYILSFFQL